MSGSYSQKSLRATLLLPEGNFPGTSSNTLTLVGYRMSATIVAASGYPNTLDIMIYGMRQQDMNACTIIFSGATPQLVNARAQVLLEASADGRTWTQVFEGTFIEAQPDYRSIPYAGLRAQAITGAGAQYLIGEATSYPGSASIATVAEYLAGKMGFVLENNGVTGNLSTPYYSGTYMDQFRELARHANFDFYFGSNGTLAICPAGRSRLGKPVPVFSPATGLIGFPTLGRFGPELDVLFTPELTRGGLGANIEIADSQVPGTNGVWLPYSITHALESLMPGGSWFSHLACVRPVST